MTFEHLWRWAQLKGVHIVGTGDVAHPGWLQEMHDKLTPAEDGLFRVKDEIAAAMEAEVPPACRRPVRFMLAGEISNIYKKHDKTRKIHNVIFAPDLQALEAIQARLEQIGNIRSDGRPILGLDSRDLLEIILDVDERCHLIPAHIWTPWFAMLGSMSGFDSVEECFDDLTPHIFALETGLSSDPPMNWRVSNLDRYTLVSNSDAHSPQKLAREATLFDTELAYDAIFAALHSGDPAAFKGTIEFFPEEGKYHVDGHRKCGVCWEPATTLAHNGICSVCGKPVTVGVMHRVERLADRPPGERPPRTHPFYSLVPLPEVLGELFGVGAGSKRVQQEYERLLARLGPELDIQLELPLEDIAAAGGTQLADGIGRMRRGIVDAKPGYDGEYGVIRVFAAPGEAGAPQMALFTSEERTPSPPAVVAMQEQTPGYEAAPGPEPAANVFTRDQMAVFTKETSPATAASSILAGLNEAQRAAVLCTDRPLIITAGPGTGKTRTLTVRMAHLIDAVGASPDALLAITFTNKAAGEMRERLSALLGAARAERVTVKTFHAFGAQLLREHGATLGLDPDFVIVVDQERRQVLQQAFPSLNVQDAATYLGAISAAKNQLLTPDGAALASAGYDPGLLPVYTGYEAALSAAHALDFDDLILQSVRLLAEHPDVLAAVQERYRWISVDEYQDVNVAQYRFLRLLTSGGANLCVIGDPDQAIYGFRGADRRFFLSFLADYPNAQRVELSQNYRSSQRILDAAQQVISQNPDRNALAIWSEFVDEVKLDVYAAPTDKAEAEYVVHQIETMVGGTSYFSLDSGRASGAPSSHWDFGDFAVLYRLGAQARPLAEAFDRSGIPYQIVGQTPLYAHKVVREVLAHLWLLENPRARVHLESALAAGKRPLPAAIVEAAWQAMTHQAEAKAGTTQPLARALHEVASAASANQAARLHALAALLDELATLRGVEPVAALIERVIAHLQDDGAPLSPADTERLQSLRRRAISYGVRLRDYLESTAFQSESDAFDPRADRVTLMTLHAAKGLEFPVVFMVGCEEGLLPYQRENESVDVEEERRLFYVGMTRAKAKLLLTHARRRHLFGRYLENRASHFVGDIEAALKELRLPTTRRPAKKDEDTQLSLFQGLE
ncbi:MAG: UvrD-helicase domain-containing protein [Caldilineaceae bacterium]|nr:UvrD-helicase domain-containing protein [Caldilineaceae bacterium]